MTRDEDIVAAAAPNASQRDWTRRAALLALGIDPATVVWPSEDALMDAQPTAQTPELAGLSDADWQAIAPLLPPGAPQANAMSNRAFLDAVLAAMRRGGAWTSRDTPAAEIEAVRRRFGRWARLGVFQALADALASLDLPPECKRMLTLAGQRAAQLKSRSAR